MHEDGSTEATNQRDEMYTSERLESLLRKADPGLSAKQLVNEITNGKIQIVWH